MTASATLSPLARAQAREAAAWIARDNPDAAKALRVAIGDAARLIGTRPLAGRLRLDLAPARYRFWSLSNFPYLVIYDASRDPPRIAQILHMARDLPKVLKTLED